MEELEAHGFGLESVREIVGKHEGAIDITYVRDMFKVRVMIYAEICPVKKGLRGTYNSYEVMVSG
ncbi:GHKL domain-containing protein [Eisenbergiella porci]|uniref:GHKL domain-containing protein n=1 Tax=Eisenbergiella porci TaxID=2652274 RepID=UPI002A814F3E|nr:GHKL domain-containing protein [Eisenbergiella porci]